MSLVFGRSSEFAFLGFLAIFNFVRLLASLVLKFLASFCLKFFLASLVLKLSSEFVFVSRLASFESY